MADFNPYGDTPVAGPSPGGGGVSGAATAPSSGKPGGFNPFGDTPIAAPEPQRPQSSTPETDSAYEQVVTDTTPRYPPKTAWQKRMESIPQAFKDWATGKVTPEHKKAAETPPGFTFQDWLMGRTTPGVEAGPFKEALGGMIQEQIKPTTAKDLALQALMPGPMQMVTPYVQGIGEAWRKLHQPGGVEPQELASTISPEYGMGRTLVTAPVGSKQWWGAALPLGIEAAQMAAPLVPVLRGFGPARGTWVGDRFVPQEFRFPGAEPPTPPGVGIPPVPPTEPVPAGAAAAAEVPPAAREVPGAPAAPARAPKLTPSEKTAAKPKLETGDVVDAQDINSRIVDAQEQPDGNWKVLLNNNQVALMEPVDPEGATMRVAQIAPHGTLEGEEIRTGESVESQKARAAERMIEARTTQEEILKSRFKERPSAGLTDYEQARIKAAQTSRQAAMDAATELEETDPSGASRMRRMAVTEYTRQLRQVYRPEEGGELSAPRIESARPVPQLEVRPPVGEEAPLRGKPEGVAGAKEPVSAAKPVAPEVPEEPHAPELVPYENPPEPGDKVVWRGEERTVDRVDPKSNVVFFDDGRKAPFTSRMKRPVPPPEKPPAAAPPGAPTEIELYKEAVRRVKRRVGLDKVTDPRLVSEMQREGLVPNRPELQEMVDAEHKKLIAQQKPAAAEYASVDPETLRWAKTHGQEALLEPEARQMPGQPAPPLKPGEPLVGRRPAAPAPAAPPAAEVKEPGVVKEISKEAAKEEGKEAGKALGVAEIRSPTRMPGEPPPIPAEYVRERPPPPTPQVQADMAARTEKAYNDLHANKVISEPNPAQGLSKNEMIEGGRAAMRDGVNPLEVARSDIRPDLKYGVMRAYGEDLRERAIALDREAKARPTPANKARAEEAFQEYSNWHGETLRQRVATDRYLAENQKEPIQEDLLDINHMVDAREQFERINGRDPTPREMLHMERNMKTLEKSTANRNAAMEQYDADLKKAAPHTEFKIDNDADLNNAVAEIMKRKFPCS